MLAQQLHLTPKAEMALRRAKLNRKAKKGLKGNRDALMALHAHDLPDGNRLRRAAYA